MSPATLPPPGDTPAYKALVAAHGELLRQLREQIQEAGWGSQIHEWLPLAVYTETLQLAKSVQTLAELGYSDEGIPLTRMMMSAAFSLGFIIKSDNPAGWGTHFWLGMRDEQRRLLQSELGKSRYDPELIQADLLGLQAQVEETKEDVRAQGIKLPKLTGSAPTWSRFSEKAMAYRGGLGDMYEHEYAFASAFVHAASVAFFPTAYSFNEDRTIPTMGPHFRPPLPTLALSGRAVVICAELYGEYSRVAGALEHVSQLKRSFEEAIDVYRKPTSPNSMMVDLFP
jgi:hypothetical protein